MSKYLVSAKTRLKTERACIVCKETKLASEFYVSQYTTRQGKQSFRLEPKCKQCLRETRIASYPARREANIAECAAYRSVNRERMNERLRQYRVANQDKTRLQRIASEQRRRAKGYNSARIDCREITEQVLELARVGDLYLDAYSGELIDKPTIDHVVPLWSGGTHSLDNLCVTSRANNISKHNKSLVVWLARRARTFLNI